MDEHQEMHWELQFNEILRRVYGLYMYHKTPVSPARLTEALASCEILRENISQVKAIIQKGGTIGTNSPSSQESPRTPIQ
jgi:hypothetical protein